MRPFFLPIKLRNQICMKKAGYEITACSNCRQTPGCIEGPAGPSVFIPQAAACTSPRSNRRLLPLSISGRNMSISGPIGPEMPYYKKLMSPLKDSFS